jgi:N-acylneuraminate cytidylyltransferase
VKALAVIPARGGSKRFPGKNLAYVNGRGVLGLAIDAARACPDVEDVVVSSDSQRILELAAMHGAQAIKRPEELASDSAALEDAARHAYLHWHRDHQSIKPPAVVVMIQPNCPIWKPGTVGGCLAGLREGFSAVATAHHVREQPDWMMRFSTEMNRAEFYVLRDKPRAYRQQECEPVYRLDGQVVALWVDQLFKESAKIAYGYMGPRIGLFIRDWVYGWDLDEPHDLPIADAIARSLGELKQ